MARRQVIVEEEEVDPEDMVPALLAAILLISTCPKCQGTGGRGACDCRRVAYGIAAEVLEAEGYFEPHPERQR